MPYSIGLDNHSAITACIRCFFVNSLVQPRLFRRYPLLQSQGRHVLTNQLYQLFFADDNRAFKLVLCGLLAWRLLCLVAVRISKILANYSTVLHRYFWQSVKYDMSCTTKTFPTLISTDDFFKCIFRLSKQATAPIALLHGISLQTLWAGF